MFVLKILGTAGVVLTPKAALDHMKSEDSGYAWGILIGTCGTVGFHMAVVGLPAEITKDRLPGIRPAPKSLLG